MLNDFLPIEAARVFQQSDDALVCIFDVLTSKIRDFIRKLTGQRHRTHQGINAMGLKHAIIILTKCRRLMHQTGAAVGTHVIIADHHEST